MRYSRLKKMTVLGLSVALTVATVAFSEAAVAGADPVTAPICPTAGRALSGTYRNLTVVGNAYVAKGATLVVRGSLRVAPHGCLDAFSLSTVQVGNNVLVGDGATLALGCAPGSNGPPPSAPCYFQTSNDTVGGSIIALRPLTMYLTAVTVGRNVVSLGGGPGTQAIGVSFAVKDMNIHGDLIMAGWSGGWIGALRNTVGGSFIYAANAGSRPGDGGQNDSNELANNTIGRNLICWANTPAPQLGDSGGGPNTAQHKIGQCTSV